MAEAVFENNTPYKFFFTIVDINEKYNGFIKNHYIDPGQIDSVQKNTGSGTYRNFDVKLILDKCNPNIYFPPCILTHKNKTLENISGKYLIYPNITYRYKLRIYDGFTENGPEYRYVFKLYNTFKNYDFTFIVIDNGISLGISIDNVNNRNFYSVSSGETIHINSAYSTNILSFCSLNTNKLSLFYDKERKNPVFKYGKIITNETLEAYLDINTYYVFVT
jgi:hypothetical protein